MTPLLALPLTGARPRVAALLVAVAAAGCGDGAPGPEPTPDPGDPGHVVAVDPRAAPAAVATLAEVDGSGVEGTVRLVELGDGVRVTAEVGGLGGGDRFHALQILASGTCDDLGDAPPHFDPDGAPHGPFDAGAGQRHAGDLGNLRAYDGEGRYDRFDPLLTLDGPRSAVGHAVVVRAEADDVYSPPDGAAGPVVACGTLDPRG